MKCHQAKLIAQISKLEDERDELVACIAASKALHDDAKVRATQFEQKAEDSAHRLQELELNFAQERSQLIAKASSGMACNFACMECSSCNVKCLVTCCHIQTL
jgi:hypothetical protein